MCDGSVYAECGGVEPAGARAFAMCFELSETPWVWLSCCRPYGARIGSAGRWTDLLGVGRDWLVQSDVYADA